MCIVPSGVQVRGGGGGSCVNALFSSPSSEARGRCVPGSPLVPLLSFKYVYCMCVFAVVNNSAVFCPWHAHQSETAKRRASQQPSRGGDCLCPRLQPCLSSSRPSSEAEAFSCQMSLWGAACLTHAHPFPPCPLETSTAGRELRTDPKRAESLRYFRTLPQGFSMSSLHSPLVNIHTVLGVYIHIYKYI